MAAIYPRILHGFLTLKLIISAEHSHIPDDIKPASRRSLVQKADAVSNSDVFKLIARLLPSINY